MAIDAAIMVFAPIQALSPRQSAADSE